MTTPARATAPHISVIAIGRNEGARLTACLTSVLGRADLVVYVDSGSTDASVSEARARGGEGVELDMSVPFTAARARNAGYARVKALAPEGDFVQFLDGDCELDEDWLRKGGAALLDADRIAVVCGRRREKFPDATLWNALTDAEWAAAQPGDVKACGGDVLLRRAAFEAVDGFREDLIAGEEPELCFRLRAQGWTILRLDAEMTRHDADMTRMSQWWQRCRRAGHTFAEGVALHGSSSERYRIHELRRTLFWGLALPLGIVTTAWLITPWFWALVLIYPAQILRLAGTGTPPVEAAFLMLSKFPELQGVIGYWYGRLSGRRLRLIEYK